MNTQYSLLKGIKKSFLQVGVFGIGLIGFILMANFPDVYNLSLVEIYRSASGVLEGYITEIFGGLTVGGLISLLVNYVKVKSQ